MTIASTQPAAQAPAIRQRAPMGGRGGFGQAPAGQGAGAPPAGAQGAQGGHAAGPSGGWMKRGGEARQAQQMEAARRQEAEERRAAGLYMPYRFFVKVGEARDIVVLDTEPGPSFFEHNLQDMKGKWSIHEPCPKEWEPCPLCQERESYFVMMLTVMDLTPYTNKDGKVIPFSRRLLALKADDQGFFMRQFDRRGNLRGLHLTMARDSKQQSRNGRPEIVLGGPDNPDFNGFHTEEEILQAFGHAEVKDQQGKVIKPANADAFPFPYDLLFKKPSAADLIKRYGGHHPAGSRAANRDEWGDGGDDGGHAAAQTHGTGGGIRSRSAPTGGAAPQTDLDDEIPF